MQTDLALRVNTLQFRGDVPEGIAQVRARLDIDGDAIAQAPTGKVQNITHQLCSAPTAGEDVLGNGPAFFIRQAFSQEFGPGRDGKQRIAQIMA
ncbi:hypothetical protein D3C75_1228750 [compost metagenome]